MIATTKRRYRRRIVGGHPHEHFGKPTYQVWSNIVSRCENPNNPNYARYGGRGITICERWRLSFAAFFEDMGEKPEGLSIDRIDNNLGYFKENCRWATNRQQSLNRSTTVTLTHEGETLPLREWCDRLDIPYWPAFHKHKLGLHPAFVLNPAYRRRRPRGGRLRLSKRSRVLAANGRELTMAEWARDLGCSNETIRRRLDVSGWTVEEAVTTPIGEIPESRRREPSDPSSAAVWGRPPKRYEFDGEELTIEQLAERSVVCANTIVSRLYWGWSVRNAVMTPKGVNLKTAIEIDGELASISEWCRRFGVTRNKLEYAIRIKGERPIDALKRLSGLAEEVS